MLSVVTGQFDLAHVTKNKNIKRRN